VGTEWVNGSPGPALAGTVIRYTGFAERAPGPVRYRELPCTYVPVILDLDQGWHIADARRPERVEHLSSFTAGLTDGAVLVEHRGRARCLQVDLTPLGARRLLGVPMRELAGRSVALEDVIGPSAPLLVERIAGAAGWHERFALVERALAARLDGAEPPDPGVRWALETLSRSGGRTPIGHLVDELGWSHRRLIDRFRDQLGLPPKVVARIVRLQRLLALVESDPAVGWARAAAACGYADQPHLTREVRELTGLTPASLLAEKGNSVQDPVTVPA
jgi:AraC-like DNA-binding protein